MTAALIAKLESASEGSRELDAEICILLQYGGLNSEGATNVRTDDEWDGDLLFECGADEFCNPMPSLTTSIDAALALAERVLPDARWIITQQYTGWGVIPMVNTNGVWDSPNDPGETYGSTLPLAICAALLRASAAEGAG